jgi:membrane-bound lytic murein transglycosylase D
MEMGLRVDNQIDERMNIASASRGAARYIKQNNFMFNNWIFALQAYQMGAGGVKRVVGDEYNGVRHMEITSDTYWYVKKFLAHKVAFEDALKKGEPQLKMQVFQISEEKTLSELAKEMAIDEVELYSYNRWIKSGKIPGDKTYTVVVPNGKVSPDFSTMMTNTVAQKTNEIMGKAVSKSIVKKEINGIIAVQGITGESTTQLADRLNVSLANLLKFNDISVDHKVRADVYYFTKKKKNKASDVSHTALKGEDLWLVSQKYGVSLKKLQKLNGLPNNAKLTQGEVVYLKTRKPASVQEVQELETPAIQTVMSASNNEEYFDWVIDPTVKEPEPSKTSTNASLNKEVNQTEFSNPVITDTQLSQSADPGIIPEGMHVVAAGETLFSISKKYGVAVTDLLTWNELDIKGGLKPGQQLKVQNSTVQAKEIVEPPQNSGSLITHEVKSSDTLYSVARQYNVSIKEIMDWNGKEDFSLSLGEKLKIFVR